MLFWRFVNTCTKVWKLRQQVSPVQDRCVRLSVRCTQSCFLQKTQALEVQTQSLPACESFILCSCSSHWLTELHLYTVHRQNVLSSKAWWEISSRRCGYIKLNQLTPATFVFYYLSPICGHLKSINKRDSYRGKMSFLFCPSEIENCLCFHPSGMNSTWGWSTSRGQLPQLLRMCSVRKCASVCFAGKHDSPETLIQLEVRVREQAWTLTRYKTHPSSPRLHCAYLFIPWQLNRVASIPGQKGCRHRRPSLVAVRDAPRQRFTSSGCRSEAEPELRN